MFLRNRHPSHCLNRQKILSAKKEFGCSLNQTLTASIMSLLVLNHCPFRNFFLTVQTNESQIMTNLDCMQDVEGPSTSYGLVQQQPWWHVAVVVMENDDSWRQQTGSFVFDSLIQILVFRYTTRHCLNTACISCLDRFSIMPAVFNIMPCI